MLGKLRSMINLVRLDVTNFTPLKGMLLAITGAGASNPTIDTKYNVTTVVRTGVGVYRVTAIQGTVFGESLTGNSIILVSHSIQPSAVSEAHFAQLVAVSNTEFDIEVTEMTVGGGNKLEVNPYDIIAGDGVDVSVLINLGIGKLPPE
jgi:hypothetical protein